MKKKRVGAVCCAFRLFVGDEVIVNGRKGFIQWIDKFTGLVSVRFKEGSTYSYMVISHREVEKTGNRGKSTLFTLSVLKNLYKAFSFSERVFFHYNRGLSLDEIAQKASVTNSKVRKVLVDYRKMGRI